MDDEDIEIPQYFTCPISLQIMKDPVTAITGITYDRDSIEHWLFSNTTCPVTKQPLPPDSDLTPNHTLRRLIQSWCSDNSAHGVPLIPTPKPPLNKPQVLSLLKDLTQPGLQLRAIKHLNSLASDNQRNVKCMAQSGVSDAVISFVSACCCQRNRTEGLEEALSVLRLLLLRPESLICTCSSTDSIVDSLTWVLASDHVEPHVRALGVHVLKSVVTNYKNPSDLSRLRPEFFDSVVGILRNHHVLAGHALNAALQVMLELAPQKNQASLVEGGAVAALVEVELSSTAGAAAGERRRTTELVFGVLRQLCRCADGRAQLVGHGGGVAVVAERILGVSAAVDDSAVTILYLLCRFSGTKHVMREILEVGAVEKLCVLLQVECCVYLKEKARDILKTHSSDWKRSPCIRHHCYYPN